MIFYTRSCAHVADLLSLPYGNVTVEQFKDGELSVKIHEDVRGKSVWVCASTAAPAENILETLFLLDALKRAGALIKVLFVYFGYARQDRMFPGQPVSVEVVAHCFQQFGIEHMHAVHIHNPRVSTFLSWYNHIPFPFFSQCMQGVDLVVAPDEGATLLAKVVAAHHGTPYIVIKKTRPSKEQVEIGALEGDIEAKNILIVDDMISTGTTLVKVSKALHEKGAKKIWAAATHGLFSADALSRLERSPLEKVFVTNTLAQNQHSFKVAIIDISPFLRTILT